MDAVVADFEAGAAEMLSPDAPEQHWDVIEGQGSLFHPAYAGVSLALLHGSQPDVIVVCHEPGRDIVLGHPGYALPGIEETIDMNLRLGRRTNAAIRCAGVSLNTSGLESRRRAPTAGRRERAAAIAGRGSDARRRGIRSTGRCLSHLTIRVYRDLKVAREIPCTR